MSLRPELTLRRALAPLMRWSWLIVVIAAATALATRSVARSHSHGSYQASVRIHEVDTDLGYSPTGELVPVVAQDRSAPTADELIVPAVARIAVRGLPGVPADKLRAGLSVRGVGPADAVLSYHAASSSQAATALDRYARAYIAYRRGVQQRALEQALAGSGSSLASAKLESAIRALPNLINQSQPVSVSYSKSSVSSGLATAGGALAGLALGALLVLMAVRFDPRVRRASQVDVPGLDVYEVGGRTGGIGRLRVDLELTGVGGTASVVAVTPVDPSTATTLPDELARAFIASGTSAIVLDTAPAGGASAPGVRSFLDGSGELLPSAASSGDVPHVPAGASSKADEVLFSAAAVERLLEAARRHAGVVIVQTAALSRHDAALLLAGAADVSVLVLGPRSRWADLERAVDQVTRIARTPLRLCFERGGRGVLRRAS